MLIQLIVNGLAAGAIYALVALAMVLIYKASEVPNFAQGEMGMISVYVSFALITAYGWSFGASMVALVVTALLLGIGLEFVFLRRAKQPSILNLIIMTLGFQLMLFGLAGWKWGAEQRRFPFPVSERETLSVGSVVISEIGLITILMTLLIMALLYLFFRFTRMGIALRAIQQNPTAARINGIPTRRLLALTFGISSVVGAFAAVFAAPITTLDPTLMWVPLLKGFCAAVLGGMTSLVGAAVGGFALGIVENLFGTYVSVEFKTTVAFVLIVAVLCIRPSGLFARHYVRKV